MNKVFNSIGHVFATFWQNLKAAEPKVEAGLQKAEATETTVEAVTAATPAGSTGVAIERAAYAILGEISAVLSSSDSAASSKLQDAGLDVKVIQNVENLVNTCASQIKVLTKK